MRWRPYVSGGNNPDICVIFLLESSIGGVGEEVDGWIDSKLDIFRMSLVEGQKGRRF